jgi:hypothetical protein
MPALRVSIKLQYIGNNDCEIPESPLFALVRSRLWYWNIGSHRASA